jgi:hypothetical protein
MGTVTTPAGNLSAKCSPGRTWKRRMRIERIVRLSLQIPPLSDTEIAISQGVTKQYVSMLRRSPEYIALVATVKTGVISQMDKSLFENIEDNQEVIKDMVPEALQALYETILDKNNPALRLKAAETVLDREGTFAKISKTEIKKKVEYDFTHQDTIAGDLLSALKATGKDKDEDDDLGVSQFTQTAISKDDKEALQKSLDLIDSIKITPGTATVQ